MLNIEIVSMSVNKINTLLPFAGLNKLKSLYLRNNNISDIEEIGCL